MSGVQWFSDDYPKGVSQKRNNSTVEVLVDADEYYADLRKEVEATTVGDLICWIGWEGGEDTPMPDTPNGELIRMPTKRTIKSSDITWFSLLQHASDIREVQIKVLLNVHPNPFENMYKNNFDLVGKLNSLKNCVALNDFRYLYLNGLNHQKLVLICNKKKGVIAYLGSCDIAASRITNKICEVQCKVMGDLTRDLYQVFKNKWAEYSEAYKRIGTRFLLPDIATLNTNAPRSGNFFMQSATSYGNPNRSIIFNLPYPYSLLTQNQYVNEPHRIKILPDILEKLPIGNPPIMTINLTKTFDLPKYIANDFFSEKEPGSALLIQDNLKQAITHSSFAPNGHTGIYQLIKSAIESASKFIYLEDQYLVCDMKMGIYESILELLVKKVAETNFKKIIIFCARIDEINGELAHCSWKHRNNFMTKLLAVAPEKVEFCQYKSDNFFVHSKTWIFDDEFLITGSANCSRRGYSHDSELNIGVFDANKFYVKEVRKKIWMKRLNVAGIKKQIQAIDLDDFISAAEYWRTPESYGIPIENSKNNSFIPTINKDLNENDFWAQLPLALIAPGFAIPYFLLKKKLQEIGMDGLWNCVIDPEGT